MINNRVRMRAQSRSHPGQLRRALRKKVLRLEQQMANQAEAERLGITVEQLQARRFEAARPHMLRPAVKVYVSPPTPIVQLDDFRRYAETPHSGTRRRSVWGL